MIRIADRSLLENICECLKTCQAIIESMARQRGHADPPAFFGDLALQICSTASHPEHHATRSYILWLAASRLKDYHRKHARHRRSRPQEIPFDNVMHFEGANGVADRETLACGKTASVITHCLAQLNPKHRDVVERKFLMDQSNEEIAAAVGMSNGGVRSVVWNTRTRLRERLNEMSITKE
ncbi:MAG TPA: hypothetical protein DD670_20435 [Planctomycetaceae bacterium]|nr:hypothetical protein [Planctomycetaceae bacterium]